MKLFATIKNERGGKKSTSDDNRILVELSYKNKVVGMVGLYTIQNHPDGSDLGYRVIWSKTTPQGGHGVGDVLLEQEDKGKKQQGECEEGGNHFTVREGDEEICRKCLKTI